MLNLIRMDFYRLFHSKVSKVGAIAAAIIAFLGMLLNFGIIEILKFGASDNPESLEGIGMIFPIVAWINGGVDFADIIFSGTATASLFVSCMVVASFIGAEQSCGYTKNIAGQLPLRGMTVISKFVVTCFVQFAVLGIFTAVSSLCAGWMFGSLITTYSIGTMIEGLLIRFLLFCAIDAIIIFFCTLTKSHAIAMVIGAIFGIGVTGLVYFAARLLLSAIKIDIDVAKFMPDGINGLINVGDLNSIVVRAIIVSVIFIVGFLTSSVLLFQKRDVK